MIFFQAEDIKDEDMDVKDEPYCPIKKSLSKKIALKAKKLVGRPAKIKKSSSVLVENEKLIPFHIKFPRKAVRGLSTDELMPPPSTNVIPNLSVLKAKKKSKLQTSSVNPTSSTSGKTNNTQKLIKMFRV